MVTRYLGSKCWKVSKKVSVTLCKSIFAKGLAHRTTASSVNLIPRVILAENSPGLIKFCKIFYSYSSHHLVPLLVFSYSNILIFLITWFPCFFHCHQIWVQYHIRKLGSDEYHKLDFLYNVTILFTLLIRFEFESFLSHHIASIITNFKINVFSVLLHD